MKSKIIYFLFFSLILLGAVKAATIDITNVRGVVVGVETTTSSLTDTNASTACSGDEYLAGDGTCKSIVSASDTNASNCDDGEYLDGSGACINLNNTIDLRDTDTNETTRVNALYSFGYYNSTDFDINDYYLTSNPFGFFNLTDFDFNDYYLNSNPYNYYNSTTLTLEDTNETERVNALYSFGYYNATDFDFNDYYLNSNPYGFYNATNPQTESDPLWSSNYTAYNASWSSIQNDSYYLVSNPYSFYNSTTLSITDTNASTACSGDEVLLGDGTCTSSGDFGGDSRAYYWNMTLTTYDGNDLGNYSEANKACNDTYSFSHVCTVNEMLDTIAYKDHLSILNWSGTVWIVGGPPGYTADANDCLGWTSADGTDYGRFWNFDEATTDDGMGWLTSCSQSKSYACCKSW